MGVGVMYCVGAGNNVGVGEDKVVTGAAAGAGGVAVRVGVGPEPPVAVGAEVMDGV